MIKLHEEYVLDEEGKKKAILIPYKEWLKMKEELEELEDIRHYDQIKQMPSDPIPLDTSLNEIENLPFL